MVEMRAILDLSLKRRVAQLSNRDPAHGMTFGILRCEVMGLEIGQIKEGSLEIDFDVCQSLVNSFAMC